MSSEQWGRVGDDGTVYVRTAEGERAVGSYPGATPEEALAYFTRKFDSLALEVDLLERRVRTTDIAVKDAQASIDRLRGQIRDANAVGDLAGLLARLEALVAVVDARREEVNAARERARERAREVKDKIVAEAERLADSTDWKPVGDRLRTLLEEWKAAPRLERRADDELWKRFSAARNAFDKRRRAHFAELDAQRDQARQTKEKLVAEAEQLAGSTDWGETAARFRDLMRDWKAAGRAPRGVEDELWQRFRTAQDAFFNARNAQFAERDTGQRANLEAKQALAAEAEALLPVSDPRAAREAMRAIHERWEAIGHVPREARPKLEGRLRHVEDAIREAEDAEWRRTNPEARARAEATVSQLRSSIADLTAKAEKARAAGDARRAAEHEAAVEARRTWLTEAEKVLTDFS